MKSANGDRKFLEIMCLVCTDTNVLYWKTEDVYIPSIMGEALIRNNIRHDTILVNVDHISEITMPLIKEYRVCHKHDACTRDCRTFTIRLINGQLYVLPFFEYEKFKNYILK